MGSWRGQRDVSEQSAAPSAFSSFHSFLTPLSRRLPHIRSRGIAFTSASHLRGSALLRGQVSLSNNWRHWRIQARAHVLPLFGQPVTVVHGTDPAPREHGLTQRLRSVQEEALAESIPTFDRFAPWRGIRRIRPGGAPKARHQNSSFPNKKLIFCGLDRAFETHSKTTKTTRESTSTKSRLARILSRVMRLENLIKLSKCLFAKETGGKRCSPLRPQSKRCSDCTYILHVACVVLRLSIQSEQKASQSSHVMDAVQPPAPVGDASVAWSASQGSVRKFVSNIRASPLVTCRSSSSRAPFSRHRLLGAMRWASISNTSRLANTSRREARANALPPKSRRIRVRFTPHRRNQHRHEHERDPAFQRGIRVYPKRRRAVHT